MSFKMVLTIGWAGVLFLGLLQSRGNAFTETLDVLDAKNMPISDVLNMISSKAGIPVVTPENMEGNVTIFLRDVSLWDALRIILDTQGFAYHSVNNPDGTMKQVEILTAEDFKNQYGFSFGGDLKTRIVSLKYANIEELETILPNMASPQGKVMANKPEDPNISPAFVLIDTPERLESMVQWIHEMDVPVEIRTFELQFAKVDEIVKDVQESLSPNLGRIRFDTASNQLIVTDTPVRMRKVADVISELDQQDKEILMETKTLQIILNDEHLEGVDWEAIVSSFQNLSFEERELSLGTISEEDYETLLEALDTVGIITTIANRRLTTANETAAAVTVKPKKIFSERGETEVKESSPESAAQDDVDEKEGVKFLLTPATDGDDFFMRIEPQPLAANPHRKEFSSATVELKDGSTIVIGGLFKETRFESTWWKVPLLGDLLGDLPLVGFAFRSERERTRKAEVITFVTPRVILREEVKK